MPRERKSSGNPTLSDVARAADVSPITVSRVLRDPDAVSEALRLRVGVAIDKIGYVPNTAARQLASARTDVIGVIIPSITNAVFADVLRGIYDAVEGTRFQIQLGTTDYSNTREEKLLRLFLSQHPAAMLCTGVDFTPDADAMLRNAGCPVVQIMDMTPSPIDMLVGFSHVEAAQVSVQHLIERGFRRIAFLGAQMDSRTERRIEGYKLAMRAAGLFDETLIMTTAQPSSVAAGASLCAELRSRHADVDAVQANNDDIAVGVMFECLRQGVRIPEDFGIAGFNDLEIMAAAFPSITSVMTHRYEMGHLALEMLTNAIAGKRPKQSVVDLGFKLIPRKSTAR